MAKSDLTLTIKAKVDVDTPERMEALRRCLNELNDIAESAPWLRDKCQTVADELSGLITAEQKHN